MINKVPKLLGDREFADLIKNAPLVSIDLIIRDRKDRILLNFRRERPAKSHWFVPGGRIRKYESIHDAILRIYTDEIERAFPNIDIDPDDCRLLNIDKHFYKKDNKYSDDDAFPDMKNEDTYYISIAYEYKTNYFNNKRHDDFKWFTIHQLLHELYPVHDYTKDFFKRRFLTPKNSELYSSLMSHYIHYDRQFWSRTQIILAIQGAAFVGAYATTGTIFPSIIMFCSSVLILLVGILIHRDIKTSRVNEKIMDEIGARLFHYNGPLLPGIRPISLRAETIKKKKWLSGKFVIGTIVFLLFILDLFLGSILYNNPDFFKKTTKDKKVSALIKPMSLEKNILHNE